MTYPVGRSGGRVLVAEQPRDGDGRTDLIVFSDSPPTVSYLANNGDGTFLPPVHSSVTAPPGMGGVASAVIADFHGRGISDVAVLGGYGPILPLRNNADGTFTQGELLRSVSDVSDEYARIIVAGDFWNAGQLDLAGLSATAADPGLAERQQSRFPSDCEV